jgi:DNA mismatch repair ATPase MutS
MSPQLGTRDDGQHGGTRVGMTFTRRATAVPPDIRPEWREEDFSELAVLDMVAKLYPDLFAALDDFCRQYIGYLDATVALADREFQFYLSYLDHIRPLREAGLMLSYPQMSVESKDEQALDTFDLALAAQLTGQGKQVVCNDIVLTGPERILVISGPNNGGKTTLARTIGQLHHLARLGCPVPGRDVRLFLCDQIFTHFEKEEDITTLAGKLQDELNRLHTDLERATPASLVVLNEVFNSTTAADAQFLSRKILQRVSELDALGVCVSFLDELSTLNDKTVSMVSQVDPHDPAIRTHKVIRVVADGRAYAHAIAEKYGLTYERITASRRVGGNGA